MRSTALLCSKLARELSRIGRDDNHGILIIHCMDARLHIQPLLHATFVTPNAYTPAGGIVEENDVSFAKRLEVALWRFRMKDIVILGHSDCAAMEQFSDVIIGKNNDPYYTTFLNSSNNSTLTNVEEKILRAAPEIKIFQDNLAVLSTLQSARNILSYNVVTANGIKLVTELVESGELRLHIAYTNLSRGITGRWQEQQFLLNSEGTKLDYAAQFAEAILKASSQKTTLAEFEKRLDVAAETFAKHALSGQKPA